MRIDIDLDDRDGPDPDDRRVRGEPRCTSCEHPYRRVVAWGMCRECYDVTADSRCIR